MKALPSIAFNDFSGTAGDVTAKAQKGRTVLTVRPFPSKVYSPVQKAKRNSLSKISRAYRELTDDQMKAWAKLAEHMKGISTFGLAAEMTAHNAFVRINSNRQMVGRDLLEDAPEYKCDVPEVEFDRIWVTTKKIVITDIEDPGAAYKLVVKMSTGQSTGVSSGWSKTVLVSQGIDEDWGDARLTHLYNKTFGFMPALGSLVFIELCWLDPETGFVGETMRVKASVITDEEAEEEGLVDWMQYTLDNVTEESHVSKLDIDFTTSAPVITHDSVLLGHSNVASSEVYLEDVIPSDMVGMFWTLGRGDSADKCTLQSYQGQIISYSGQSRIVYMHRGGYYVKPTAIFGTGVFYKQ